MSPIKTVIHNNRAVAKAINYVGESPVWLPANGDAVVDYEIWSVANDSQKAAIKALCESGAITLTLMVLGPNGEYTSVVFSPVGGAKPVVKLVKKIEEPVVLNPVKEMVEEKDHIVKVGTPESQAVMENMGAKAVGFKEEEILPVREIRNMEPEEKKEEQAPAEEAAQDVETTKKTSKKSAKKA